jgi:MFS family permease
MEYSATEQFTTRSLIIVLLPIMGAIFAVFLVTGMALPVLPIHVHDRLGFGTFVVGLVAGAQFAAALLSRFWSGTQADRYGGKKAVVIGLIMGIVAGVLYFLSFQFKSNPTVSVIILLSGRAVFGATESFVVTGALSWGLSLGGSQNAGKVMAWVGTAMYVALALGAPLGTAIYNAFDFISIAVVTTIISLITLFWVLSRQFDPQPAQVRPSFKRILGAVSLPGVGLALSSIGFGAITTFVVLLFAGHGWGMGWMAVTIFAFAFVLARIFFSHLADTIGGAKVALVSAVIEAVGLLIIWLSPWPALVFIGAAVTGFGYSLVYPGFGVEAVHRAPPESRGLAMGAFTAFLDLALGIANPLLGLIAEGVGLTKVFLFSAFIVAGSAAIAIWLLSKKRELLAE